MIHRFILLVFIFVSITIGQDIDSTNVRTPKQAALWSILPGGGQIYNKKYVKAGIIIALESFALQQSIANGIDYNETQGESDLLDRNKFAWWTFFIHIYGLLDAVVDSHLEPFEPIMESDSLEIEIIDEEITPNG